MAEFPDRDILFNPSEEFKASQAMPLVRDWFDVTKQLDGGAPTEEISILDNNITPTAADVRLDTEGEAPEDELITINTSTTNDGMRLRLWAKDANRTIHVRHSNEQLFGIRLAGGQDKTLQTDSYLELKRNGNYWNEVVSNSISVESSSIDTFRKSFIGVPRWWRSTILPPNHVWADGSLMLFADWPEFAEIYQAGGFSGMTLPADSAADAIAAAPAKWVINEAGTGLYTPRLGGWFMRNWTPGQTKDVGRAAGTSQAATQIGSRDTYQAVSGAYRFGGPPLNNGEDAGMADTTNGFGINANYSGAVYIEYGVYSVRPSNLAQPVCIYLGNPALTKGDE